MVTGQLADTPTRGLPTRGLDDSQTRQLAYWTSRGLDNSRSRRCCQKGKLSTQSRRWHPRLVQYASCLVCESSSPRVVTPRVGVSASCPVTVNSVISLYFNGLAYRYFSMQLSARNGYPGSGQYCCPHWKSWGIWCGLESGHPVLASYKLYQLDSKVLLHNK